MKIINGYRVKDKKYKVLVQQNWLCEHEVIATNKKDITTRFLRDNDKKINKELLLKERVIRITKISEEKIDERNC
tara:strand:- start:343 stop:567 length:225 start_codon:yes stop_codon:yes gene_type:complete